VVSSRAVAASCAALLVLSVVAMLLLSLRF
jgi:hypothetical protein